MYFNLIKMYIKNLRKEHIVEYAKKEGIDLNENEIDAIYNTINKNWEELYKTDGKRVLNNIKNELREETYQKLTKIYKDAKEKLL